MALSKWVRIFTVIGCGLWFGGSVYGVRPRACSIDWVIEELAQLDAELAEVERGVYSARTLDPELQTSLALERKELETLTERSLESSGPISEKQVEEIQEALSERSSGVASVREKAKGSIAPPVSGVQKIRSPGLASVQQRALSNMDGFAGVEAESVYPLPSTRPGSTGEVRVSFHSRCLKAISGLESETQQRFWSALLNGPVGAEGSNGIKRLSGQGGRRLAFEIKHRSVEMRIYGCLRGDGVIAFLFVDNHKAVHRIYELCEK